MDDLEELDPDWDHVPPKLLALEGKRVTVGHTEGATAGVLVLFPGPFGDVARRREAEGGD